LLLTQSGHHPVQHPLLLRPVLICFEPLASSWRMSMSSLSVPYVLGGTVTEQQRLISQARGLEIHARSMIDRIPIEPGARSIDVGCGPIGIMNLLSERVGSEGTVVGVEREPRFVEMARAEVSQRGLQNVQIVNADALRTGLEKNSFDVVHERLVFINVPPPPPEAIF